MSGQSVESVVCGSAEGSDMTLAIGAVASDGIVLAADKRTSCRVLGGPWVSLSERTRKVRRLVDEAWIAHCGNNHHNAETVLQVLTRAAMGSTGEKRGAFARACEVRDAARDWMEKEKGALPRWFWEQQDYSIALIIAGHESDGRPALYRLRQSDGYRLGSVDTMVVIGNEEAAPDAIRDFYARHGHATWDVATTIREVCGVFRAATRDDGPIGSVIDVVTLRREGGGELLPALDVRAL